MHHVERKAELAPAALGDIEPLQPTGGDMRVDQMRRPLPRNGVRYQSAEGAIVIAPTAALGVAMKSPAWQDNDHADCDPPRFRRGPRALGGYNMGA
jgi:hypothetical protein